jgi:hypothetical protein
MKTSKFFSMTCGIFLMAAFTQTALSQGSGQVIVAFQKTDSTITEPDQNWAMHLIKVGIESKQEFDGVIEVEAEPHISSTASPEDYELVVSRVLLDESNRTGYLHLKVKSDSKNEDAEKIVIRLKENDKYILTESSSSYALRVNDATKIPSPDSFAIGTNFDFLNGTRANHFYYDLRVSLLDLGQRTAYDRAGLISGLKQHRTISVDMSGVGMYPDFTFPDDNVQEDLIIRNSYNVDKTEVDYLSLYLQPTYRINLPLRTFNFYALLHAEILQIKTTSELNLETVKRDTIPLSDFRDRFVSSNRISRETPNPVKNSSAQTNFGVGLMFHYFSSDMEFKLKMIGGTNLESKVFREDYFYLFTFDLTERNSLIRLGGEIRADNTPFPGPVNPGRPTISIYLAKEFSLQKIASFFGGD